MVAPVGHKEWPTESEDRLTESEVCPTQSSTPALPCYPPNRTGVLPTMPTSPQRRRRILHAHELRQAGQSLRQIATALNVSHATIHADLKLFETDCSGIAEQTADDFLFEHVTLLRRHVHRLLQEDPTKPLEAFSFLTDGGKVTPLLPHTAPAQIARLHEVHHRAIATALREYRLILRELRPAAKARALADADAEAFDFPDDQLLDAPRPKALPDPAKTQPKLNEPNHLRPVGPPTFEPAQTPEQRERTTLSIIGDYERNKTTSTNPDQPQPPRPDTQPLETATSNTPPDTPTTEPPETPETDAELEARMHAQLDILEQAALKRFPELAQTD